MIKLKATKFKDGLLWIMRPVLAELPLFFISFILLAANTIHCGLKLIPRLLQGSWPEIMTIVVIYLSIAIFIAYLTAFIAHITHKRWVKILLYGIMLILFGVFCFVQLNFSSIITPTIMMAMTETNAGETSEFFEQFAFTWQSLVTYTVVARTIITIVLIERRHYKKIDCNGTRRVPFFVLVVLLGCIVWGAANMRYYYELEKADFLSELEKSQMFSHNTYAMDNVTDWLYCLKAVESSENEVERSMNNTLACLNIRSSIQCDSLIVILVIGESYIKSHASIYGYQLPTTPRMEELNKSGNLVSFTNCISPYNTTNISLKNALSTNSIGDNEDWYDTPYWSSMAANAGYATTMWDNP
jgi:heptose-I-phosphate ethanolaminephosphotransferase